MSVPTARTFFFGRRSQKAAGYELIGSYYDEAVSGADHVKDNPHGVLVRQDELTQLIGGLDAYKSNKGSDRPALLSLIDGSERLVDRAGSGSVRVPCWGASVIGGIQPKKIKEMARDLDSDGLLQRFIPIWGGGVRPPQHDRPPNAKAKEVYSETEAGRFNEFHAVSHEFGTCQRHKRHSRKPTIVMALQRFVTHPVPGHPPPVWSPRVPDAASPWLYKFRARRKL